MQSKPKATISDSSQTHALLGVSSISLVGRGGGGGEGAVLSFLLLGSAPHPTAQQLPSHSHPRCSARAVPAARGRLHRA